MYENRCSNWFYKFSLFLGPTRARSDTPQLPVRRI